MILAAMRLFIACSCLFASELIALCVMADEPTGLFVAVGYGGRRISSRDAVNWENDQRWSDTVADDDNVLFNIAFGHGRFIAVGGGAKIGRMLSTRDGKEWQTLSPLAERVGTVAFGNGRFVAMHDAELLFSTDGITFDRGEKLVVQGSVHARRSAFGDTEAGQSFVIIGDIDFGPENRRVSWRGSTTDGQHWAGTAVDTSAATDIAYGAGHFVIVGPEGLIETSHDGLTWQRRAVASRENFARVVWTGKRFLATGAEIAWRSDDGIAWQRQPSSIPCKVVWARDGWLGLGTSWGGAIWRSEDFIQWKKVVVPAGPPLEAVAFGASEATR